MKAIMISKLTANHRRFYIRFHGCYLRFRLYHLFGLYRLDLRRVCSDHLEVIKLTLSTHVTLLFKYIKSKLNPKLEVPVLAKIGQSRPTLNLQKNPCPGQNRPIPVPAGRKSLSRSLTGYRLDLRIVCSDHVDVIK